MAERREGRRKTINLKARVFAVTPLVSSITLARSRCGVAASVPTSTHTRLPHVRPHTVDILQLVNLFLFVFFCFLFLSFSLLFGSFFFLFF